MNGLIKEEQQGEVKKTIPPVKQEEQINQKNEEQKNVSNTTIDYSLIYKSIVPVARENKDLVNFAYYLYKQKYVVEHPQNNGEWIAIRQRVNFCNCAKLKSTDSKERHVSRLAQMYTMDIFGGSYYTVFWSKNAELHQNMISRCPRCYGNDGKSFPFCPYYLCFVITKTAEAYKAKPETLFAELLGNDLIDFRGTVVYKLNKIIESEDIKGIHSKSAYAAYLLLTSKLVKPQFMDGENIRYSHFLLCRDEFKNSVVQDVIQFWKNGSGRSDILNIVNKESFLQEKTDGCKKCSFEQCPHKLAAYFMYLGKKYGIDPIDLSWYIAKNSTYAKTDIQDNYQIERFISNANKSSMREEDKTEYIKMIHFIAGRKMNHIIPFLPFNMAVTSTDKEKATEVINGFCNALWHFDYYRCGSDNTKCITLYLSTLSFSELCDQYTNATIGTTFILHDTALLCEDKEFKNGYHKFLKIMEDKKAKIMSIIIGTKEDVNLFFTTYPEFKSKIFSKALEVQDMDNVSVADALIDKLETTFSISEEMKQQIEQYIRIAYPSSMLRSMEFVNDLYEQILFNHFNHDVQADTTLKNTDLPYIKPPRSEEEIFDEINKLTGLDGVKKELKNVNDLVKFNIKMESGYKNAVNLHMTFTGNPGTGKTTVARLTAEILHSIGFIQENKLVVCSAKDLVGEYLGQTTPKTAKMCEQAYNGVLFIDEAYQLNPYTSPTYTDTYKEECIAELIQQMENNRDKLVVIFAGYTDEMEDFLNKANTGLRSRIGKTIHFPDYSAEELLDIFTKIVEKAGMKLGDGTRQRVYDIFDIAKKDSQRFGNARYARNLYERSLMQHAAITANLDKDDPELKILHSDEITIPGN